MKFSTKEDIEVPIKDAFEMLCAFETFERAAARRGAVVTRLNEPAEPGSGQSWTAEFPFRGKMRTADITLITFDRPNEMVFECRASSLSVFLMIDLIALSRERTRIRVITDIKPRNLSARLKVQSMRLAKPSLTKKYMLRFAEFARTLEARYTRAA